MSNILVQATNTVQAATSSPEVTTMAQAYVEQKGYYRYLEFPMDEDRYLWIGRKKGQPKIGIFKKTKHGRKGQTFTPEQYQRILEMTDSIHLALSLIEPKRGYTTYCHAKFD